MNEWINSPCSYYVLYLCIHFLILVIVMISQEAQLKPEARRLDIESFLIKPLQRLCRYPLLLKELLKQTDETHPDHKHIVAGISRYPYILFYSDLLFYPISFVRHSLLLLRTDHFIISSSQRLKRLAMQSKELMNERGKQKIKPN